MRFESISILNYRQYRDFELTFPSEKDTDLHVIIASNGIGKTNILNAINWCLYNDEPHLGDTKDSLSICNYKALDDAKAQGKKNALVKVSILLSTDQGKIILERSADVNTSTQFVQLSQLKATINPNNGNAEILLDEKAQELINQHLPRKIRQYFFFDGEQLYNYFGRGQDTSHVKDSIYEIAQVNVVCNTRAHLDTVISDFQREIAQLNPKIDELNKKKTIDTNKREEYEKNIRELEKNVAVSQDTIATLEFKISGTETIVNDNDRYKKNEAILQELESQRKQLSDELKDFVKKFYCLLMMYEINSSTSDYIMEKYKKGVLPPDIDIDLIRKSLSKHECVICRSHIDKTSETYLQSLLDKYKVSTNVSHKLVEIKNDILRFVREAKNYRTEKEALFEKIRATDETIEKLIAENEVLYKKICACSKVDEIKEWVEQRSEHQKLINTNNQKIGAYKAEIDHLTQNIDLYTSQIGAAINDVEKCEKLKDQLNFATDARKIVASIEHEMTNEVRERMEQETMKIFSDLIWKKNTYCSIRLDDNYNLKLYHTHTGESCLGSCSAAERELLALAFTIALHRVSGHDGLLFIDTPVGRVSDANRENFARSLIDVSKTKQLILAFTPSEFSEEISNYFNSSVLSSFRKMIIDMDEKETSQEA